jgi:fatty acid desaturase
VIICDLFGTLSHSLILVPFHPWRLSHAKHHRNTAHCENDESFIAVPEDYYVYASPYPCHLTVRTMTSMGVFFRFYAYWFGGYMLYLIGGIYAESYVFLAHAVGMPVTFHSHILPLGHIYPTTKNKIESTVSILCVFGMGYLLRYPLNEFLSCVDLVNSVVALDMHMDCGFSRRPIWRRTSCSMRG